MNRRHRLSAHSRRIGALIALVSSLLVVAGDTALALEPAAIGGEGPGPGARDLAEFPAGASPSRTAHVGTLVARYVFPQRAARLGPPPPWQIPAPFAHAVDPAIVVGVQAFDEEPRLPTALRVAAVDGRPAARAAEPAPAYHWSRGSVYTTLDAGPYEGRLLRILATVRLAELFDGRTRRSPARFWVRVDGPDPTAVPLVHEDSGHEIGARWREVAIDVPVLPGAAHIHFGLDVATGAADLAEVKVVDLGPSGLIPPIPLHPIEVDRLVVLARVLGAVRFFHPSSGVDEADWDAFTIDAVETVLASGDVSFATTLRRLLAPVAPLVTIDGRFCIDEAGDAGGSSSRVSAQRLLPGTGRPPSEALQIVRWNHYGLGLYRGDHPYRSDRVAVSVPEPWRSGRSDADVLRDPTTSAPLPTRYETTYVSGDLAVTVTVPLLLYSGVNGTLPLTIHSRYDPRALHTKPFGFLPVCEDRTTRLAATILLWNVVQHFFPEFDEILCDWPAALPGALRESALAPDRLAFQAVLERLLAPLEDGHADVHPYYSDDSGRLPFDVTLLDGHAWVSAIDPALHDAAGRDRTDGRLRVGDELVAIDGIPVRDLLVALGNRVSAATAGSHQARTREKLLRGRGGELRLCTFARDGLGPVFTLPLELESTEACLQRLAESRRPALADLGHGILYLDAARIDDAAFRGTLPALTAARGVVVDCRGYPGGLSPRWLEHWLTAPASSPQWHVPVDRAPDRTERSFVVRNWTIHPEEPRITAPTVFLTGPEAISRAETYLAIVRDARIGRIVGQATAGTNGNILPFTLPGGLRVTITGMKVRTQNGGPFHGIGIHPDIEVPVTLEGIRSGRDEVLEAGVEELSGRR